MALEWDRNFYLTGYEGVEAEANFPTPQALEDYRRHLLDKTESQIDFIARQLGERKLRVIEFGSGNGRLLIGLALQGLLETGLGIEISQSRVDFAQRWTQDLKLANLRHIAADALTFEDYPPGAFDLAVCITGAFGYFKPIRDSAPVELLAKMRRALAPGSDLLLELYQMPEKRRQMLALNENQLRVWQLLPPEDRFAYYLDDLEYAEDLKILKHGKIFIGRDGLIDAGRVEMLAYYTDTELLDLLRQKRFEPHLICADFQSGPYKEGISSALIVVAQTK